MRFLHSLIVFAVFSGPAWSLEGLDALTAKTVSALSGAAAPRAVLMSPTDCYDAATGMSLPLAVELRSRVVAALQAADFHLGQPPAAMTDVWVLECHWKVAGERLSVTLTATPWVAGQRGTVQVLAGWLPVTPAVSELLRPDLASYGRTLVHRLALEEHLKEPWRVYLRPLEVGSVVGGRPANDFFNTWLSQAVAQSNLLIAVQSAQTLAALDKSTLRTRGIRPKAATGMSLTGDLVAAQGEVSGAVVLGQQQVRIDSVLHDAQGQALVQAAVEVPLAVLPATVAADLAGAGASGDAAQAPLSRRGLAVELSTSHGEGKAKYRIGEKIAFLVRVNRDAYVYLFDLDAQGEATLLYPAFQVKATPLPAGQPLLLPDDGMAYALEVTEPPGRDRVWVVASERPLDLPPELTGEWAKAATIMDRVRGLAGPDAAYAEAQLLLDTSRE
ncbi:DUF4384 domain-containing protein [uncultured Thiodictyon sp.]|uniref:DUF4384 domain-containing protein n=1 Tax=uncultured Thiodictyon sp. TaxID=1846217 RepID=UPI0025CFB9C2|nr:DUF4384 domain-containing protein [uncultured Thiodictyon sp.]